ncbi:CNH domain-containing protein [Mycena amicta]|nr:CNH domain-containing protein [Mycena amicta]
MGSHHITLFAALKTSRLKQQQQKRQHPEQPRAYDGPSPATKPGPQLPLEILERIIDFLHAEKTSLLACSLVCRVWFPTSRYHLYVLLPVLPEILAEGCHKVNSAVLLARDATLYGTTDGVYLGRDQAKLVKLLKLPCAQIDVLESHDMLLILSGRRLLIGPLHMAVGPLANPTQLHNHLEVLSSDVSFFQVGDHAGKRVVCIVSAGRFSSHFKVVEAVHRPAQATVPNTISGNLIPFRSFYLPEHARNVHIFNKTIGATLRTGFQCVDPISLVTYPVPQTAAVAPEARKCRAMFRVDDSRFLLCYDRCAFFMNKAGTSSESTFAIRWSDSAKRFALSGSQLLLAFVPGAMHVWRLDTGALVQTVWGGDGMQMLCAAPRVLVRMGDGRVVRLKVSLV